MTIKSIWRPEDIQAFFDVPKEDACRWLERHHKTLVDAIETAAWDVIETEGAKDGLPPVD